MTLTHTMSALAEGNSDVSIAGVALADELGDMAKAVLIFRDAAIPRQRAVAEREQAMAKIGDNLHAVATPGMLASLGGLVLSMPNQEASTECLNLPDECTELFDQKQHNNILRHVPQHRTFCLYIRSRSRLPLEACAAASPTSAQRPRTTLISMVHWRTSSSRERCRTSIACRSAPLAGTKRMAGRRPALQVDSATAASLAQIGLRVGRQSAGFSNALCKAIAQVMAGQADDLGGGVFKKRLHDNDYRSIVLAKGRNY